MTIQQILAYTSEEDPYYSDRVEYFRCVNIGFTDIHTPTRTTVRAYWHQKRQLIFELIFLVPLMDAPPQPQAV